MIVAIHLSLELKNPYHFKNLNVDQKNYIYDFLDEGKLLFVVPPELEDEKDKNVLFSYKTGFLNDLLNVVYGEKYIVNQRKYEIISKKYYMFYTYRTYSTQINLYQKLFK